MTYDAASWQPAYPAEAALDEHLPAPPGPGMDPLLIDCDMCSVRGIGCGDCVVTVVLGGPPLGVTLNDEERHAVDVLAAAGLVPPLRLVHGVPPGVVESA